MDRFEDLKSRTSIRETSLTEQQRRQERSILERMKFEDRVSYKLNSDRYIRTLKELGDDDKRQTMLGLSLQYLVVNPDCYDFDNYVKELTPLVSKKNSPFDQVSNTELLVRKVADKLNMYNVKSDDQCERIYQYFDNNYFENGYYFHSFNGVFKESIQNNGLNKDLRIWDWSEVDRINQVLTKAGEPRALGWLDLNCKGKLSISDTADKIYRYAVASPEWFAQFVSDGMHIPLRPPYDKKAFYKRDYDAAKTNVSNFSERLNISSEEKNQLMDFFDKYWNILAGPESKPKLAMIKREAIGRNESGFTSYKEFSDFIGEKSIEGCIDIMLGSMEHDLQIEKNIDAKDILIVDLPDYNSII